MLQPLKLETMVGGAVLEEFDSALAKTMMNIVDPNCPAKAARKVIMTVTIKPNEKRDRVDISFQATTKLPDQEPLTSEALVEVARDGSVAVVEMFRSQDPGRTVLPGCEGPSFVVHPEAVNPFDKKSA